MSLPNHGISQTLNLKIHASVALAPQWSQLPKKKQPTLIQLRDAHIIPLGTMQGNPTVDLVAVDEDGNEFLIITTANIVAALSAAMRGVKTRGQN